MKPRIRWVAALKLYVCFDGTYAGVGSNMRFAYHMYVEATL